MIRVENLSFSFGDTPILKDFNLEVQRGECFGIFGPSGSGKTTLLNILTGRLKGWTGQIFLDGKPIQSYSPYALSSIQRLIFQDPYSALHPKFTLQKTFHEISRAHKIANSDAKIKALFQAVHLDPALLLRFPHQLSGGQRQRAVIASCLLTQPKILYLDEPTSALDASVQAELLNLLKDLQEAENLTYVFITHDAAVLHHMSQHYISLGPIKRSD